MERDAEKKVALEKERKNGDKLLKYFIIKKPDSSNTFVENTVGERGGGGDVRILKGGVSSPAKRRKPFNKLLSYWENKTSSENPEDNN